MRLFACNGADAVEAASAAMSGEAAFYGATVDSDSARVCCASVVVEGLRKAAAPKAAFWEDQIAYAM
ncbi:hypothetical protein ACNKHX_05620 [Shigella flexneri]